MFKIVKAKQTLVEIKPYCSAKTRHKMPSNELSSRRHRPIDSKIHLWPCLLFASKMKRFIETWHDPIFFFGRFFFDFRIWGFVLFLAFQIYVYFARQIPSVTFSLCFCVHSMLFLFISLCVSLWPPFNVLSVDLSAFFPHSQILKHFQNLIALWIRYFSACQTETTTKHINNAKQVPSVPRTVYTLDKIQKPFWRSCA